MHPSSPPGEGDQSFQDLQTTSLKKFKRLKRKTQARRSWIRTSSPLGGSDNPPRSPSPLLESQTLKACETDVLAS